MCNNCGLKLESNVLSENVTNYNYISFIIVNFFIIFIIINIFLILIKRFWASCSCPKSWTTYNIWPFSWWYWWDGRDWKRFSIRNILDFIVNAFRAVAMFSISTAKAPLIWEKDIKRHIILSKKCTIFSKLMCIIVKLSIQLKLPLSNSNFRNLDCILKEVDYY